jgi:hypothetical protein
LNTRYGCGITHGHDTTWRRSSISRRGRCAPRGVGTAPTSRHGLLPGCRCRGGSHYRIRYEAWRTCGDDPTSVSLWSLLLNDVWLECLWNEAPSTPTATQVQRGNRSLRDLGRRRRPILDCARAHPRQWNRPAAPARQDRAKGQEEGQFRVGSVPLREPLGFNHTKPSDLNRAFRSGTLPTTRPCRDAPASCRGYSFD